MTTKLLLLSLTIALAASGAPPQHADDAASWERIPLDREGRTLGRSLPLSRAMRDEGRLHRLDNCMIAWALRAEGEDGAPLAVYEGKLELRIESTEGATVVRTASVASANLDDSVLASCVARAFEGQLGIALESSRRWRVLFLFKLHRRPLAWYRAKYPPPERPAPTQP